MILISDTKKYIQGKPVDTIDKSLRDLQAIYEGLKNNASRNQSENDALSLLEPLKEMEIVKEPEQLYEQYAFGGIESIHRRLGIMPLTQFQSPEQQVEEKDSTTSKKSYDEISPDTWSWIREIASQGKQQHRSFSGEWKSIYNAVKPVAPDKKDKSKNAEITNDQKKKLWKLLKN